MSFARFSIVKLFLQRYFYTRINLSKYGFFISLFFSVTTFDFARVDHGFDSFNPNDYLDNRSEVLLRPIHQFPRSTAPLFS